MIQILLIESNPARKLRFREALTDAQGGPFGLEVCDDLSGGLARLREGGIDAVLVDPLLEAANGLTAREALRDASPHVGIVELLGDNRLVQSDPQRARGSVVQCPTDTQTLATTARHAIECARLSRELDVRSDELGRTKAQFDEFVHILSHDFREPLRMVESFVQLLARRYANRLDAEADRFIRYACDGADRMNTMIEALLRYARIGRGEYEPEPVSLQEVLEDTVAGMEVRLREAGARVTADALPTVTGSSAQLKQLFQILIDNAITFRGDDAPEVHVRAVREGSLCTVSVSDNGIGFDADHAERIFLPFQRLCAPDEHPGTGIGLALARRIAERHAGRAWAESAPGAGSVFHFSVACPPLPEVSG